MTPELLASQAFLEPRKMPLLGIHKQIAFLEQQSLPATEYKLVYWSRILKPLTFFGMALLALAIVIGPLRSSGMGQRLTIGIFCWTRLQVLTGSFCPHSHSLRRSGYHCRSTTNDYFCAGSTFAD